MGDVFFNCGLWLGEVTSASRFFGVLDEIDARLAPAEREDWLREVVAPIRQQLWNLEIWPDDQCCGIYTLL